MSNLTNRITKLQAASPAIVVYFEVLAICWRERKADKAAMSKAAPFSLNLRKWCLGRIAVSQDIVLERLHAVIREAGLEDDEIVQEMTQAITTSMLPVGTLAPTHNAVVV